MILAIAIVAGAISKEFAQQIVDEHNQIILLIYLKQI